MASLKIHEQCKVTPPSTTQQFSLPLTLIDLFWLRFHPVERVFFYTLPDSQSHPSFFFNNLVPKLKTSLSITLQYFLPLAGKIIWPSNSPKPIIKFNPEDNDGISLILAQYDDDHDDATFNQILKHNSPREAIESRAFVSHLESSDSFASVISIQITLFPKSGFCIGISTHHAVLDGKSSTMFLKAWASICKSNEKTPSLLPELEPFYSREVINDSYGLDSLFLNNWNEMSSKFYPNHNINNKSMKITPTISQQMLTDSVRATFELTRGDLDNINKTVLAKWNIVEGTKEYPKPMKLSTFVLTCAYVSICMAKATQNIETDEKQKFALGFPIDYRAKLEPSIPENYFGNCVAIHFVDEVSSEDFTMEDGLVIIAKKIYGKIKSLDKGTLDGVETIMFKFVVMMCDGVKGIGVAGSTRFGVYETDFGWGRPAKAEIILVNRGFTMGLTESKDNNGGVEIGLVLNKNVMDLFCTLFHAGLCFD